MRMRTHMLSKLLLCVRISHQCLARWLPAPLAVVVTVWLKFLFVGQQTVNHLLAICPTDLETKLTNSLHNSNSHHD